MSYDTIYTCDGCGKKEPWQRVERSWNEVRVHAKCFGPRRADEHFHVCSTACEKRILLKLAGQQPTAEQAEAEARAAQPDLAKRLDEQEIAHRLEVEALRAGQARLEVELMRTRSDMSVMAAMKQSPSVTHEELRGLLQVMAEELLTAKEVK